MCRQQSPLCSLAPLTSPVSPSCAPHQQPPAAFPLWPPPAHPDLPSSNPSPTFPSLPPCVSLLTRVDLHFISVAGFRDGVAEPSAGGREGSWDLQALAVGASHSVLLQGCMP
ncbi:unnamed protein product [Caretta caretta]